MKLYGIVHHYTMEGPNGTAIPGFEVLLTTSDRVLAEKYVEKNSRKRVYETPNDDNFLQGVLTFGELEVEEIEADNFDLSTPPPFDQYFLDCEAIENFRKRRNFK